MGAGLFSRIEANTTMDEQVGLQNGMDVNGADGEKLGSIYEVRDQYFIMQKGFFFPKDYYIPLSAVQSMDPDQGVYLNVTKDVALNQGWDAEPADLYGNDAIGATADSTYAAGSAAQSEVIDPSFVAASDTAASGTEAARVPVYEEQITPIKRSVDRGAVRIEKELVTEERTITVPVTEERVRITQIDANDMVGADAGDAFQEGVIEVPLTGEEVELQKTARKTGEVIVEKEAVQHDEQISGSVRREEVRVDDQTMPSSNRSNPKTS